MTPMINPLQTEEIGVIFFFKTREAHLKNMPLFIKI